MENKNLNEVKDLNEKEINEVSGGASEIEKLKYRSKPSGLIDNLFSTISCEENCRVCGKPIIVRHARPPMRGCPDSICDECAKKEREEEGKAKTQ